MVQRFLHRLGYVHSHRPAADSPVPELPRLSVWTEEDADQLKRFLTGTTGQKLTTRLQAVVYKAALDEAHNPQSPRHAAGYDACRQNLLSLATTYTVPIRADEMDQELDVLERHSP